MSDAVQSALSEILTTYRADFPRGKELGTKLAKKKELKDAFAPIAKLFEWASHERIVQACLELPADHPLHLAAAALRADGTIDGTPWVSIGPGGQPKRSTRALLISRSTPVAYAAENGPRVSLWSLESGVHLADLAIPGKKTFVRFMVELDDGTLRVIASDGAVLERAPGATALVAAHALGAMRAGCAIDADLRWAVCAADKQPSTTEQQLLVHDLDARTSRAIRVAASGTNADGFAFTGGKAIVAARRPGRTEDDPEQCFLVAIDPASGAIDTIEFPGDIGQLWAGPREGTVGISWTRDDPETGEYSHGRTELDLATRAQTPIDPDAPRTPPRYDRRGELRDAAGALVGRYEVAGEPHSVVSAWDDARNVVAIGGGDPEVPVVIVAPYDPGRAATPAASPAPTAEPLAWARPGTVLRYEIADFDAADTYVFEVLDAASGLVLAIRMDESDVWPRARFSDAALEKASRFVAIAQGSTEADLAAEHADVLPPIVIARAVAKKLAAGKGVPFQSEWTEKTTLEPGARELASVRDATGERVVAVLRASSDEGVSLTVLDDPRWPLVIERVEGDCHVRLLDVDTSRARTEVAPMRAAPALATKAPAVSSASDGARRFELVEGGSAKFWEIQLAGSQLTVRFGKIGTSGQTQLKDLGSPEAAQKEHDKLVREKTKKGYAPG